MSGLAGLQFESLGDCSIILRSAEDDATDPARWQQMRLRWLALECPGLLDIVPTVDCLALHFHADWVAQQMQPLSGAVTSLAERLPAAGSVAETAAPREHVVPVCYGGEYGPDLESLAETLKLSTEELIARHTASRLEVRMLGFLPGFAYLEGLDESLHVRRHARPREHVAAGSVGIGGRYSGIYPQASPGGWQLIGRSPWAMFDASRERPCRLAFGDIVRFEAISAEQFEAELARDREAKWD